MSRTRKTISRRAVRDERGVAAAGLLVVAADAEVLVGASVVVIRSRSRAEVRPHDSDGEHADAIRSEDMMRAMPRAADESSPLQQAAWPVPNPPPWELGDDKLLAEVRIDSYVASGPGG